MKNRKYVVSILICLVLMLFVFGGCDTDLNNTYESLKQPAKMTLEENYISYPEDLNEGDIIELEVPDIVLLDTRGDNKEEIAESFKKEFETQQIYMDDIYVNEDGKTIMVLTKEQMEKYICFLNGKYKKAYDNDLPMDTSNVSIEINEDFTCVNYYVTEDCELFEHAIMRMWIEPSLAVTQTILGIPSNEWQVKHTVYYGDNEVVMLEFYSGANQDGEITGEEWEQKKEEAKTQAKVVE